MSLWLLLFQINPVHCPPPLLIFHICQTWIILVGSKWTSSLWTDGIVEMVCVINPIPLLQAWFYSFSNHQKISKVYLSTAQLFCRGSISHCQALGPWCIFKVTEAQHTGCKSQVQTDMEQLFNPHVHQGSHCSALWEMVFLAVRSDTKTWT